MTIDRAGPRRDVRIDWFVRFEIKRNFLLLAFISQDGTDEKHETIWWNSVV